MPLDPLAARVATERCQQPHRVAQPAQRESDIRRGPTHVLHRILAHRARHDVDEGLTNHQHSIGVLSGRVGAATG